MADPGPVEAIVSAVANLEQPHTFSPLHYQVAYHALRTKSYTAALPVLDDDIYKIAGDTFTKSDGSSPTQPLFSHATSNNIRIRYQEVVAYFLYGGMIYLAVGNYDRAIQFFELAAVYPTNNTASKIQVEAYKKWILVNLFHKGKVPALARQLGGQHQRILTGLAKAYEAVKDAFQYPDVKRLAETVHVGRGIWNADFNAGLISLVLRAHQRFAISSLSTIYRSIPIKKIHELAFSPSTTHNEVYEYIANLIASGQLSATLTQPAADSGKAYLRFTSSVAESAEVENLRMQLATAQQAKINEINEYVKEMTHTLQMSRPFLESLHKTKKKNGGDPSSNGTAGPSGAGSQYLAEDEDEYLETL